MVSSKINKEINYIENKEIDLEDKGYHSNLYEIYIKDIPVIIALGKQKYTYQSKKVLFYPIYLIIKNKIRAQIGVYEITSGQALNVLDEDGDIDLHKMGKPLLYSFVNEKFIEKIIHTQEKEQKKEEKKDDEKKILKNELERMKTM